MNSLMLPTPAETARRPISDHGQPGEAEIRQLRELYWAIRRNATRLVALALITFITTFVVSQTLENKYTAVAQVMLDTRVNVAPEFTPQVSGLPTTLTSLESEIQVLRSEDLIVETIFQHDLLNHPDFSGTEQGFSLRRAVKDGMRAVVGGVAGVIEPSDPETATGFWANLHGALAGFSDATSETAADPDRANLTRLEATAEKLRRARVIERVGDTSAVYRIAVTTPKPRLSADLANALAENYLASQREAKLETLRKSQSWLTGQAEDLQERLYGLSSQLENLEIERPFSPEEYATIQARRTALTQELRDIAVRLEPNATIPLSAEERAAVISRRALVEGQVEVLQGQQALQAQHIAAKKRIENEILVTEAIYKDFVEQLSRRTQQDQYLQPDARIIELARPDFDPSEPRRLRMTVAAGIAVFIFAVFVVILRELMQNRLRTVPEYETTTGLPFLGVLPSMPRNASYLVELNTAVNPLDPASTQFARKLRTSVDAAALAAVGQNTGKGITIAGFSALRGEGQSSAIATLALSYAEAGFSVLIIDTVVGGSYSTHMPVGAPPPIQPDDAVDVSIETRIAQTADSNIHVLPIFGDKATSWQKRQVYREDLRGLLTQLQSRYDRILIDTAPLLEAVDAVSFLKVADAQVLFLRWNHTDQNSVTTAVRLIDDVKIRPSGVIATRLDLKRARLYGEPAFQFHRIAAQRSWWPWKKA